MGMARSLVTAFLVGAMAIEASGAGQAQIDAARNKGLKWLLVQQRGDGSWRGSAGLEVTATSLVLEAFKNAGMRQGYHYGAAVAWLENSEVASVDSLARKISALSGTGVDLKADLDRLLSWQSVSFPYPNGSVWGAYDKFEMSFPDTALALKALRVSHYSYPTQDQELSAALCMILTSQRPDGSWGYGLVPAGSPVHTQAGAIFPTALTAMEIQGIITKKGWSSMTCNSISYPLATAVTKGISWLLSDTNKNSDGGFGANGVSDLLDTAVTYQALTAVNSSDPARDAALDYLVAAQDQTNGSWRNDPLQTALVLTSFTPANLVDLDQDGIPDGVESILGTNPSVADSRGLIKGDGLGVSGVTSPALLVSATMNRFFSINLTASGGTPPYTWGLVSGSLPPGVGLTGTTGTISGSPESVGTYPFLYSVTDHTGIGVISNARIDVAMPPVKTTGTETRYFGTLQSAYDSVEAGPPVIAHIVSGTLTEELIFDRGVAILLSGGLDESFSSRTGETVIQGSLTIRDGEVTADSITIN
uniref:Squalene cyclase C-terminal domain-containing protein n=1 Tax=Geobacter metallireducens TaxID=28232 RepID=A0A831U0T1_GEOME